MAIKLNKPGYDNAVAIIKKGLEVAHESNWESEKPDRDEMARYLETHDLNEYGLWFLAVDSDKKEDDRYRFLMPYGDFNLLHKSALLATEKQAEQRNFPEIKVAAQELLKMLGNGKK